MIIVPDSTAEIVAQISNLRRLRSLALAVIGLGASGDIRASVQAGSAIVQAIPRTSLKALHITFSTEILAAAAMKDGSDGQDRLAFKEFETAVLTVPSQAVTFSLGNARKNNRVLWTSCLGRAFPQLKNRGMLRLVDQSLACKCCRYCLCRII